MDLKLLLGLYRSGMSKEANSKSTAEYINSKIKEIELINIGGVFLFFSFFSSFMEHLRIERTLSPIFTVASFLEGAGVVLLGSLCLTDAISHSTSRSALKAYPILAVLLCLSNTGAALRYFGRVLAGLVCCLFVFSVCS